MEETIYERVEFDADEYAYRADANGELVTFPKLVNIRLNGEVIDTKLSFTTKDGHRVPCVRIGGERVDFDHPDLEIAADCLIPVG